MQEAQTRKAHAIDTATRAGQIKRDTIKLTMRGRITKKLLYATVSQTLRSDLRQIVDRHRRDCVAITARYQRLTWADWLRQQALAVYAKSGVGGRAELSAFFLEDLLVLPTAAR